MRDIDSNILAELAKEELRPFLLLDMEIDSIHYRYTDCDVPIVLDGNTYSPRPFQVEPVKYSTDTIVDQVAIDVDNLDEVMTSLFVGGTPQGSSVVLSLVIVTADNNTYYMPVSTEGLVGYWPFDDGSGSIAKDKSGNGNNGTLHNMEEADWVDGIAGKCLSFDGVAEYVNITNHSSLRPAKFTIAAWVKGTATNYKEIFQTYYQSSTVAGIEFRQDANNKLQLISGKNTGVVLGTDYQQVSSAASINTGNWLHVVGTYDGVKLRVFINGVNDGEIAWTDDPVYAVANNRINIGVNNYVGTTFISWWDGLIDEVRVYKRALTETEIKALYNLAYGSATLFDGKIDQWNLDEERLRITVTSEFAQWSQRTLSRHGASCRWKKFKGTECGYSGSETWCDRTYARCQALANTDSFGGFRWLPSIIDKEIWWGRLRGENE